MPESIGKAGISSSETRLGWRELSCFIWPIGVYIWVFPRHIPFRNLKGHFLTAHTAQLYRTWISEPSLTYVLLGPAGSYVSPSIHGWAVSGRITLEVSENCWLCLGWFRGNVTFMVKSSICRFFLRPIQWMAECFSHWFEHTLGYLAPKLSFSSQMKGVLTCQPIWAHGWLGSTTQIGYGRYCIKSDLHPATRYHVWQPWPLVV